MKTCKKIIFLICTFFILTIDASKRAEMRIKKQQLRKERIECKRIRYGDPHWQLISLADAYIVSRAIHVAAELGIADQLKDSPKNTQQIAQNINVNPDALNRMMRLLALYNVFELDEHELYHLTSLSAYMVSDSSDSLRVYLTHEDEACWNAFGNLLYTIKTGKPAFDHMYGTDYFSYLKKHKNARERFHRAINNFTEKEEEIIAKVYGFSDFNTIIDVGGGLGGLLRHILMTFPQPKGILYDLPNVIKRTERLKQPELEGRLVVKGGNFFESVPVGGDLYVLKRVLHDWNNQECITVLKNIYQVMNNDGRLLVIEAITDTTHTSTLVNKVDVLLMTLFGGRERNEQEFNQLLHQAGFRILNIIETGCMLSIIEAEKK